MGKKVKKSTSSPDKPVFRIGIDFSILDRTQTGTSVYAWNLFQSLRKLDQDSCEFVALRAPKPLPRKNILTKFGNFFLELLWYTLLLPIHVRNSRIDLMHMPANTISPLPGIPQVCSIHDAHFLTNPQGRDPLWRLYARWTFRYAARHADRILCDSFAAREEVVELLGASPENIDIIYLGLPHRDSLPADAAKAAAHKPYILSVGATDPNKNFTSLLQAYTLLIEAEPSIDHRLLVAGPPGSEHPMLMKLIDEKGLGERVELLGRVSDSMLAALYENASLFVFPSLCEGFGFPPLEAMHHGVPVVASHAPCIPEILADASIYFDPNDIQDMREKMQALLSEPELSRKLSIAGKERARRFTWEKTAENTLAVYRSLLLEVNH